MNTNSETPDHIEIEIGGRRLSSELSQTEKEFLDSFSPIKNIVINMNSVTKLEQDIYELYIKIKEFEELFGVGGNAEAEEYIGYGKTDSINSLGRATAYGRCQQAWTQAKFAMEQVMSCGPQNIQFNQMLLKRKQDKMLRQESIS